MLESGAPKVKLKESQFNFSQDRVSEAMSMHLNNEIDRLSKTAYEFPPLAMMYWSVYSSGHQRKR